jgi:nicotinamidase-related amidase
MSAALLLIDVVNPMDFRGAELLMPHAMRAAESIRALKHRAHVAGVPVIYVNDNYGRWHVGFRELIEEFRDESVPGMPLIDALPPDLERDVYVLKPMLSGFYNTSLDALLASLEVRRLILTGIAGNICVLFTANDAHMRGYDVLVPSDCVASETRDDNEYALGQMRKVLSVDTRPSPRVTLVSFASRPHDGAPADAAPAARASHARQP